MNHPWSVARLICAIICLASVAILHAEDKADDGLTLRLKLNKGDSRVATCRLVKQGATEAETESIDADIQMTVLDVPAPAQYKLGFALVRVKAQLPYAYKEVLDVDSTSPTFAAKFPLVNALRTIPFWEECDDRGELKGKQDDLTELGKIFKDKKLEKTADPHHFWAWGEINQIFAARTTFLDLPDKPIKIGDIIQEERPIEVTKGNWPRLTLTLCKREQGLAFFDVKFASKVLETNIPLEGDGRLTIHESTGCLEQFEFSMKIKTADSKIQFKEVRLSMTEKDSKK